MHDTGRNFKPIFVKFASLMRVCQRINPIVFGKNRPNRITDIGGWGNVPQNLFFVFSSDLWVFLFFFFFFLNKEKT